MFYVRNCVRDVIWNFIVLCLMFLCCFLYFIDDELKFWVDCVKFYLFWDEGVENRMWIRLFNAKVCIFMYVVWYWIFYVDVKFFGIIIEKVFDNIF